MLGLQLLLACAPLDLLVQCGEIIEASIESLRQQGITELPKHNVNSSAYKQILQNAEILKQIKSSYQLFSVNNQSQIQQDIAAFNF